MNLYETDSMSPDVLIAGVSVDLIPVPIVLASGSGALQRGQLLGRILTAGIAAAVRDGGNTGEGTCTELTKGTKAEAGVYVLRCFAVAADAGSFVVNDPGGVEIGQVIASTGGTAFESPFISFTLTAAGVDFALGDGFDITVAPGSGSYGVCDLDSLDGTQAPAAILAIAADATDGDVTTAAYIQGEFNERAVVFASGETADMHRAALQALGIILRPSVAG